MGWRNPGGVRAEKRLGPGAASEGSRAESLGSRAYIATNPRKTQRGALIPLVFFH